MTPRPVCCVFFSTVSAFTLGGGCTIISWDQCWPCPFSFVSVPCVFSLIALFHTCLLLALCGYWTHLALVHVPEVDRDLKELQFGTVTSSYGHNCLTNVGENGRRMGRHKGMWVFEMQNELNFLSRSGSSPRSCQSAFSKTRPLCNIIS